MIVNILDFAGLKESPSHILCLFLSLTTLKNVKTIPGAKEGPGLIFIPPHN